MTSALIAIGAAAVLFTMFGIAQSLNRRETPGCACYGGSDHCDVCPNHLETHRE